MLQKAIRTVLIISVALVGLTVMLLVLSTLFQRIIGAEVYGLHGETLSMLPQLPLVPLLMNLIRAGCVALLFICCRNTCRGIWPEILILIALVLLPFINDVATGYYRMYLASFGDFRIAAYSILSGIFAFCCYPAGIGQVFAYLACGMSIASKTIAKKQNIRW